MLDALAAAEGRENPLLFVEQLRRDDDGDRVADRFGGCIAKEPLGALVSST
jgi:hypothetical protein